VNLVFDFIITTTIVHNSLTTFSGGVGASGGIYVNAYGTIVMGK